MRNGKPTPEKNPWGDAYSGSAEVGVNLTTCDHCGMRTWILKAYIDPIIPECECANCGCVWEAERIIEPAENNEVTHDD